jgi:hypothetical protein
MVEVNTVFSPAAVLTKNEFTRSIAWSCVRSSTCLMLAGRIASHAVASIMEKSTSFCLAEAAGPNIARREQKVTMSTSSPDSRFK